MVYSDKNVQWAVEIFKYGVQESGLSRRYKFEAINIYIAFKYILWLWSEQINYR